MENVHHACADYYTVINNILCITLKSILGATSAF